MLWVTCTSFQQHRSSNGCPAFLRYSMYLKMYLWNNQNQNWSPNFQSRLEFIFNFLSVWHRKHCIRSPNNRCIRSYPMMRGKGGIPPPPPHLIMTWLTWLLIPFHKIPDCLSQVCPKTCVLATCLFVFQVCTWLALKVLFQYRVCTILTPYSKWVTHLGIGQAL